MFRKILSAFLVTVFLEFLMAVPAEAVIHHISIGDFFFSPTKTVVARGDTVQWTVVSGLTHSTTSDVGSPRTWDSGPMGVGGYVLSDLQWGEYWSISISLFGSPLTMQDTIFTDTCFDQHAWRCQ